MPRLPLRLLLALLPLAPARPALAAEEQAHGLAFERWVADTFFDGYRPENYTARWDIPAAANRLADPTLRGLPVNPKLVRLGSPVGFGDALRQHAVDEPFLLVLGLWRQTSPTEKEIVRIHALRIEPAAWRALWGPVTRADLETLDARVKDRARPADTVRAELRARLAEPPFSASAFTLHPKLDAAGQRRLQCSLPLATLLDHFPAAPAPDADAVPDADGDPTPTPDAPATLWGRPFPNPLPSPPRRPAEPDTSATSGPSATPPPSAAPVAPDAPDAALTTPPS